MKLLRRMIFSSTISLRMCFGSVSARRAALSSHAAPSRERQRFLTVLPYSFLDESDVVSVGPPILPSIFCKCLSDDKRHRSVHFWLRDPNGCCIWGAGAGRRVDARSSCSVQDRQARCGCRQSRSSISVAGAARGQLLCLHDCRRGRGASDLQKCSQSIPETTTIGLSFWTVPPAMDFGGGWHTKEARLLETLVAPGMPLGPMNLCLQHLVPKAKHA